MYHITYRKLCKLPLPFWSGNNHKLNNKARKPLILLGLRALFMFRVCKMLAIDLEDDLKTYKDPIWLLIFCAVV